MSQMYDMLRLTESKDGPIVGFKLWAVFHKWEQQGMAAMYSLSAERRNRLEELRAKWDLRARLEKHAVDGYVYVCVRQRDCDMAEWTERHKVEATHTAFGAFMERLYEDAEGSVWWSWMTPEEYDNFQRESRDLALEAFEDGHPHVIHG